MIARVIKTNEMVEVRQANPGGEYFIDSHNNPYKVDELDFAETANVENSPRMFGDDEQMNNFAAFMQDQNEKLYKSNESLYYRKLKGDVLLKLIENFSHRDSLVSYLPCLVDAAHEAVERLKLFD